jgi:HAD superfamily hydrolase (TIGR01549 family)
VRVLNKGDEKGVGMLTTVLMDYDATLHDWDGVIIRCLDGILGMRGEDLYRIWVYDVHRALIHRLYLDHHDDAMFHCRLLFRVLGKPFDQGTSNLILERFREADEEAMRRPIYFPDAVPALRELRSIGLTLCLSTGHLAEEKAQALERATGEKFFSHVFSEPMIGCLKTEPEYYMEVVRRVGCEPDEAVSVGDTPLSDIRPAKLVGIHTIWVNRRAEPTPTDPEQVAEHEARDLREAVGFIKA